jgi:hypothetical protein
MRTVFTGDAFGWLADVERGPVVAQLPDAHEIDLEIDEWREWFDSAIGACLGASSGPTVFLQTDRKADGTWISKAQMVMNHAAISGRALLWHKVALRRGVGKVDVHRPGYTHVLAIGPGRPGRPRPDVLKASRRLWENGAPAGVAMMVAEYLREQGHTKLINPFCGRGTLLAAAEACGLDALGAEIDPVRAQWARSVEPETVKSLARGGDLGAVENLLDSSPHQGEKEKR